MRYPRRFKLGRVAAVCVTVLSFKVLSWAWSWQNLFSSNRPAPLIKQLAEVAQLAEVVCADIRKFNFTDCTVCDASAALAVGQVPWRDMGIPERLIGLSDDEGAISGWPPDWVCDVSTGQLSCPWHHRRNVSGNTTLGASYLWSSCDADKTQQASVWATPDLNQSSARAALGSPAGSPDVFVFTLDSMSKAQFEQLPAIGALLRRSRAAGHTVVEFGNYRVVGNNSPENMVPLLSGSPEPEMHKAIDAGQSAAWIWEDFQEAGYWTGYSEEICSGASPYTVWQTIDKSRACGRRLPDSSSWEHNCLPVEQQVRTAGYKEQVKVLDGLEVPYCLGGRGLHALTLEFADALREHPALAGLPLASFHDLVANHEDSATRIFSVEGSLAEWVSKVLSSTRRPSIVILHGDHGMHRAFHKWALDASDAARLAFTQPALVVLASHDALDERMKSTLASNANKLITAYDLHATLVGLAQKASGATREHHGRGIDIMHESLPEGRSCKEAHIPPNLCVCTINNFDP